VRAMMRAARRSDWALLQAEHPWPDLLRCGRTPTGVSRAITDGAGSKRDGP
jgi:hypothetical protein